MEFLNTHPIWKDKTKDREEEKEQNYRRPTLTTMISLSVAEQWPPSDSLSINGEVCCCSSYNSGASSNINSPIEEEQKNVLEEQESIGIDAQHDNTMELAKKKGLCQSRLLLSLTKFENEPLDESVKEEAYKTLRRILWNVVNYPNKKRYRTVRMNNVHFNSKLGNIPASFDLMHAAGAYYDVGSNTWQIPESNDTLLEWALETLDSHLLSLTYETYRRERDARIEQQRQKEIQTLSGHFKESRDSKNKERERVLKLLDQDKKEREAATKFSIPPSLYSISTATIKTNNDFINENSDTSAIAATSDVKEKVQLFICAPPMRAKDPPVTPRLVKVSSSVTSKLDHNNKSIHTLQDIHSIRDKITPSKPHHVSENAFYSYFQKPQPATIHSTHPMTTTTYKTDSNNFDSSSQGIVSPLYSLLHRNNNTLSNSTLHDNNLSLDYNASKMQKASSIISKTFDTNPIQQRRSSLVIPTPIKNDHYNNITTSSDTYYRYYQNPSSPNSEVLKNQNNRFDKIEYYPWNSSNNNNQQLFLDEQKESSHQFNVPIEQTSQQQQQQQVVCECNPSYLLPSKSSSFLSSNNNKTSLNKIENNEPTIIPCPNSSTYHPYPYVSSSKVNNDSIYNTTTTTTLRPSSSTEHSSSSSSSLNYYYDNPTTLITPRVTTTVTRLSTNNNYYNTLNHKLTPPHPIIIGSSYSPTAVVPSYNTTQQSLDTDTFSTPMVYPNRSSWFENNTNNNIITSRYVSLNNDNNNNKHYSSIYQRCVSSNQIGSSLHFTSKPKTPSFSRDHSTTWYR